jgi:hypothetical protein
MFAIFRETITQRNLYKYNVSKWTFTYNVKKLVPAIDVLNILPRFRLLSVMVKVNFALEQAMKAQKGSRGIAVLFL